MQETTSFAMQITKLVGSLALVLLILLAGVYALRRWGHWLRQSHSGSLIQVVAQHAFGPKHFLLVVQVQEERFLIGVSPQGMHTLAQLGGEDRAAPSEGERT